MSDIDHNDTDPNHFELTEFDRAAAAVEDLVAAVRPDGWTAPTPCEDWDVRALVNHVVAGGEVCTAPVIGAEAPPWEGDHLGADPLAAYRSTTSAFRTAMSTPGVLTTTYDSILGREPGSALVRIRIAELVAHGWDLARALGRSTDITPDLARRVRAFWAAGLEGAPRGEMPFGEPQDVPEGASEADRLAAYLGRAL